MLPTDEKQKITTSSVSVMRPPEKVYSLYKNCKDFQLSLPSGWNDKYIDIFVKSCRMHLDDLKKTENDDNTRWHSIALYGAKASDNNSLFTISSCMKVAQLIKTYVIRNLNRMVNNEIFHTFYCDVKDLLEYFPAEPNCDHTRSNSSEKTLHFLDVAPELEVDVEEAIFRHINRNVSAVKDDNNQFWEELTNSLKEKFGVTCDIKEFLRLKKKQAIKELLKIKKISERKRAFNEIANKLLLIFDYIEPVYLQRIDFLNPAGVNSSGICLDYKMLRKPDEMSLNQQPSGEKSNEGQSRRKKGRPKKKQRDSDSVKKKTVGVRNKTNILDKPINSAMIEEEVTTKNMGQQQARDIEPLNPIPSTSQQKETRNKSEQYRNEDKDRVSDEISCDNERKDFSTPGISAVQCHKQPATDPTLVEVVEFVTDSRSSHNNPGCDHPIPRQPGAKSPAPHVADEDTQESVNNVSSSDINEMDMFGHCSQWGQFRPSSQNSDFSREQLPVNVPTDYNLNFHYEESPNEMMEENSIFRGQLTDDKNRPFKKRGIAITNDTACNSDLSSGKDAKLFKGESSYQPSQRNVDVNQTYESNCPASSPSTSRESINTKIRYNSTDKKAISPIRNIDTECDKGKKSGPMDKRIDFCPPVNLLPIKRKRGRPPKVTSLKPRDGVNSLKEDDNMNFSREKETDDKNRPLKKRGRYTYSEEVKVNVNPEEESAVSKKDKPGENKEISLSYKTDIIHAGSLGAQSSEDTTFSVSGENGLLRNLRNRKINTSEPQSLAPKKRGRPPSQHQPKIPKKRGRPPKKLTSDLKKCSPIFSRENVLIESKKSALDTSTIRSSFKETATSLKLKNGGHKHVFTAEYCIEKSLLRNLNPVVKLIDFRKQPSAILSSQVRITKHTLNNENIKITDKEIVTITLKPIDNNHSGENQNISEPVEPQASHLNPSASTSHDKQEERSDCIRNPKGAFRKTRRKVLKKKSKNNGVERRYQMKLREDKNNENDRQDDASSANLSKPNASRTNGVKRRYQVKFRKDREGENNRQDDESSDTFPISNAPRTNEVEKGNKLKLREYIEDEIDRQYDESSDTLPKFNKLTTNGIEKGNQLKLRDDREDNSNKEDESLNTLNKFNTLRTNIHVIPKNPPGCSKNTIPHLSKNCVSVERITYDSKNNFTNNSSSPPQNISNLEQANTHENSSHEIIPNLSIDSLPALNKITALQLKNPHRARIAEFLACSFDITHPIKNYSVDKPGWFKKYSHDYYNWERRKFEQIVSNSQERLKVESQFIGRLESFVESL